MKNKFIKRTCGEQEVARLIESGLSRIEAEVLALRGVTAENFDVWSGGADGFHSPFEMQNMEEAAETVNYLMDSGGSVLIYGDYDADGLTASALLSLFFTDNGVDNDVIIPTRDEGYGIHCENIAAAMEQKYYDLIITVDCGISNADEIARLRGIYDTEIIVTDHHEVPENLPECICVNPKMGYPFPFLSGSGVAWKLVEALAGRDAAVKYADLAAIGAIADMMPLTDENRALVRLGLENFNHKGLLELAEISKCRAPLSATDIAMKIAPKINAAGRVGSPDAALELLLARDKADKRKAEKLFRLNELRKKMLDDITAEADAMCDLSVIRREKMVFLADGKWAHGLLGIAASRYRERYNFPSFVMTKDGSCYVGSARGAGDVNLYECVAACADLLVKYGGHKASVGFTVEESNLTAFRSKLASVFNSLPSSAFERRAEYDADIDGSETLSDLYSLSCRVQPCLPSDRVTFRVKDYVKFASLFGKENNHISFTLSSGLEIKGFFKYAAYLPYLSAGAEVDLLCTLEYDCYSKTVYGILEELCLLNSLRFDNLYKENFFRSVIPGAYASFSQKVPDLSRELGVAAVFDDYATYMTYLDAAGLGDFYADVFLGGYAYSQTAVISPDANYDFSVFDRVVVFTAAGFLRKGLEKAEYIKAEPADETLYSVEMNRTVCAAVYSALRAKSKFDSVKGAYDKYLTGKLSYAQFLAALSVFSELGLVYVTDNYTVELPAGKKAELTGSSLYRYLALPDEKAV